MARRSPATPSAAASSSFWLPSLSHSLERWLELNAKYAEVWPNITEKRQPPADADDWKGKPDKANLFSPNPGLGD